MKRRLIALGVALAATAGCSAEPALVRQMRTEQLINAIRQLLFESVEAEKSAVLATTDEESKALASEARRSAADINRLRGELRVLIVADGRREEVEKLDAFDASWSDLEGVDQRLLALAVGNTNLKATRLSAREGAAALDRFVDGLAAMQRTATDPETIRTLSRVSVAALRGQSLLLVHIPTADEAEMTRLEQRMGELSNEVDRGLASTRDSSHASQDQLATTLQAWSDYKGVAADVVRLSRENTNIISFDVSVHEKRGVTKECLAALSALLAAVESGPQATR